MTKRAQHDEDYDDEDDDLDLESSGTEGHESEYQDPDDVDTGDDEGGGAAQEEPPEGVDTSLEIKEPGEETSEEREAIRQRRREERHAKKLAAREREERYRADLAARDELIARMQAQLNQVTQHTQAGEAERIARVKQESANAYGYWKNQIKEGTETQNGAVVAEATEKMLQAQARFNQAVQYEQALVARQQQQTTPQLDPRLVNHASNWIKRNPWYDPKGTDPDSRRTRAIDTALAAEGYDSNSPEYWEELTVRVKNQLPHRFARASVGNKQPEGNGRANGGDKPRSVVGGTGRNNASPRGNSSAKGLSAERVQALKDAGLWDDPAKRTAAIKEFQAYDKEHAS